MSSITVVSAGDDIEAAWGASVANHLNGPAVLSAATGNITTSQTQVVAYTIAANTLAVGDIFMVQAMGVCTSSTSTVVTFRIRLGTTTLTGNIATANTPTANNTASADPFWINGMVTVRSIGSSGTVHGGMTLNAGTQPFGAATRTASGDPAGNSTSTVVLDTTATKLIELTAVTAAGTTSVNFTQAAIWKVRP
jgi:hypothetical protein